MRHAHGVTGLNTHCAAAGQASRRAWRRYGRPAVRNPASHDVVPSKQPSMVHFSPERPFLFRIQLHKIGRTGAMRSPAFAVPGFGARRARQRLGCFRLAHATPEIQSAQRAGFHPPNLKSMRRRRTLETGSPSFNAGSNLERLTAWMAALSNTRRGDESTMCGSCTAPFAARVNSTTA